MSEWHYTLDGQKHGPVAADVLKQLVADGRLKRTDTVWREGLPNWIAASETTLFTSVSPPPIAAPAPAKPVPLNYHRPMLDDEMDTEGIPSTPVSWIGGLLLVGFILPIIGPGGIYFLNLGALFEPGAPVGMRLFCLHPLVAGIAALCVANSRTLARPITLLVVGALALLIFAGSPDMLAQLSMGLPGKRMAIVRVMAEGLAILGMVVGSWVTSHRPYHRAGPIMGAIGSGLYLLLLFVPSEDPLSDKSTIPLIASFKIVLSGPGMAKLIGLAGVAQLVMMVWAAVLCFRIAATQEPSDEMARNAFRLVIGAFAVSVGAVLLLGLLSLGSSGACGLGLVIVAKMIAWFAGLLMLLPVGLADLIVKVIPRSEEQMLAYGGR
jgi:hypothetical protein